MSRVFHRGGGRGGTGNGTGNNSSVGSSQNHAGNNRSRGAGASATHNQRDWKEDLAPQNQKESFTPATTAVVPVNSVNSFPPNILPPQQQQHQNNQSNQQQQQGNQGQRNQQPSRQLYQPKPRGNSEKSRGSSSGSFGNYDHNTGGPSPQNRDNEPNRQFKPGNNNNAGHQRGDQYSRDHRDRNKPRQAPPALGPQQQQHKPDNSRSNQARQFDSVSSRETSSVETNENEEAAAATNVSAIAPPSTRSMTNEPRDNIQSFLNQKLPSNPVGPQQGQIQNRREQKMEPLRGTDNKRDRPDQGGPKPRMDQSRPTIDQIYQNSFEGFGKSLEDDADMGGAFGRFNKNGHVDSILGPSPHTFDQMPPMDNRSLYDRNPPNSKYFPVPVGMGDIGHMAKMGDRGFDQSSHDTGDIFLKDNVWRGPEREERNMLFQRNEPSPPGVIPKSLIWSNQSSTTSLSHPQADSSHFGRPMGSGFPMDHGGFSSNLLNSSPSSIMDAPHMDMGMRPHMMHNMPINQFLMSTGMPDRMNPSGMDRMSPMFGHQQGMNPHMAPPVRFHPQAQFSESFIPTPLVRDQNQNNNNRMPQQGQMHQQQQQGAAGFMAQGMGGAGSKSSVPRSPQTVNQEKEWTWEERADVINSQPDPPPEEPAEDFGEFKCPQLHGAKNFDNLCAQAEELRKAIQEQLKSFVAKPHKERLRRVMILCFTFWNVIRDAIMLDNVQACDKSRELDQLVWREGFYPLFSLLRNLADKSGAGGKHESVGISEALKSLISKGLTFYTELIPRILHPFGGTVTPHILVNALAGKPMAGHMVICLDLAERLLGHLGDLYRYQAALSGGDPTDLNQAREAYRKACLLAPYHGQPHNQLALVAKKLNQPLEVVFHAIRATSARLPYAPASAHLTSTLTSVDKTYETRYGSEDRTPVWTTMAQSDLWKRLQMVFLAIHNSLYQTKPNLAALTTNGTALLGMLDAVLHSSLTFGMRDGLLEMTAINIFRLSVMPADGQSQPFLVDLSFCMFDTILARLMKIFDTAPDLDSAAHLEDTTLLAPVVKVFVEWFRGTYQKWYPLSPSQLSSPQHTKRTGMWSRLVSLVNLSLTLNVVGVAEERFQDGLPAYLYEDLFLAGMAHVYPTLNIFYRETKLHETIAEPRFRFRKMQPIGMVLLSVSPPIARLQWNRFIPNEGFLNADVKTLWAPLEPPPSQRTEPLPTLERIQNIPQLQPMVSLPAERPATSGWNKPTVPVMGSEQNPWPTIGQANKQSEERRDRVRTGSSHSASMDEGMARVNRNGESSESTRTSVESWWQIDQRLRSKEPGNQLRMATRDQLDRSAARAEESSKQYYVVDTNCLIDYLDRIEKKMQDSEELIIIVPGVVSRELWKLHEKKNRKAHEALSFISDTMEHSKNRLLIVTTKGEHIQYAKHAKNEIVTERGSNDDIILRTCLTLGEKGLYNPDDQNRRPVEGATMKGSMILLTSDVNMRVKARKENIGCRLIGDVLGQ